MWDDGLIKLQVQDKTDECPEEEHFSYAIAKADSEAAKAVKAKVIAVFTRTGYTARLVSKCRPEAPIIAFSPDEQVVRQMQLFFGHTAPSDKAFEKNGHSHSGD